MARVPLACALLAPALAACCGGCARPGPPGGGPVDTTAPFVVSTTPSDGATGVAGDAAIEIRFSEDMDREATGRALSVSPEVPLGNVRWSGAALAARPPAGLPDSTTFVVSIGTGARDGHGVALAAAWSFAFSTGAALDAGVVSGRVLSGGSPATGAAVWLVRGAAMPDSTGLFSPGGRSTSAGQDGGFRLTRVAASPVPYSIVAFADTDRDGRFDPSNEAGAVLESAARIGAPGDSAVAIAVELASPGGGREEE